MKCPACGREMTGAVCPQCGAKAAHQPSRSSLSGARLQGMGLMLVIIGSVAAMMTRGLLADLMLGAALVGFIAFLLGLRMK